MDYISIIVINPMKNKTSQSKWYHFPPHPLTCTCNTTCESESSQVHKRSVIFLLLCRYFSVSFAPRKLSFLLTWANYLFPYAIPHLHAQKWSCSQLFHFTSLFGSQLKDATNSLPSNNTVWNPRDHKIIILLILNSMWTFSTITQSVTQCILILVLFSAGRFSRIKTFYPARLGQTYGPMTFGELHSNTRALTNHSDRWPHSLFDSITTSQDLSPGPIIWPMWSFTPLPHGCLWKWLESYFAPVSPYQQPNGHQVLIILVTTVDHVLVALGNKV